MLMCRCTAAARQSWPPIVPQATCVTVASAPGRSEQGITSGLAPDLLPACRPNSFASEDSQRLPQQGNWPHLVPLHHDRARGGSIGHKVTIWQLRQPEAPHVAAGRTHAVLTCYQAVQSIHRRLVRSKEGYRAGSERGLQPQTEAVWRFASSSMK